MRLTRRIEALERTRAERWKAKHCICLTDARFHTDEEAREAYVIPCPVHGRRVFKCCFIDLSIQVPLHPADRHLCHCPPMLARQAAEEGGNGAVHRFNHAADREAFFVGAFVGGQNVGSEGPREVFLLEQATVQVVESGEADGMQVEWLLAMAAAFIEYSFVLA